MSKFEILYEDKHIICVVKPYGVMSQGNENVHSLCDCIKEYLTDKGERGDVFVVHRLDKTTGGVMVYAKTKEAAAKLSALVVENKLHKTYLAVVCGKPEKSSDTLTDLLYHDKQKNKTFVVKRERKGVKEAKLSYETLCEKEVDKQVVTVVKVKLYTGRTHQIRVQFASRKHPLAGDRKYGSTIAGDNIALWSHSLCFSHPVTKENVEVSALPTDRIFDMK